MILISSAIGNLFQIALESKRIVLLFMFSLFIAPVLVSLISSDLSISQFIITKDRTLKLFKTPYPNKMQGPLSHPRFSKKSQDEVASYIIKNIDKSTRLCFYEWALVAELPVLVDRVFFPFPRCGVNDILVVGPYQKGIYALKITNLNFIKANLCKKILFNNDMYTLCTLKNK